MPATRRSFVHGALAGAACVTLGQVFAQGSAPKRKLRKAVMYGTVRAKGSVMEKFKAIREAGFEGVEPNGGMEQAEVLDALKANDLEAASVCCHTHWKDTLTHPDAATRKRGIEGLLTTLRNAKAYGAGSILLVPGVVNAEVTYDAAWKRSQECVREAIPLAKELGVRISIENVWNNFLLSPLEMARFIDEFDSPWVGSHFDIGNVYRYGWPEQWIRILGKRINRLHFKEFDTEKMNAQGLRAGFDCDFLTGKNDWKAIMHALDDIAYTGWCIAEQRMGLNPGDMKKLTVAMNQMIAM
jgi:L-ribulose-5-phosphate 3-epimerase